MKACKAFMKTFWGTTRKCKNKNVKQFSLRLGSGQKGLKILYSQAFSNNLYNPLWKTISYIFLFTTQLQYDKNWNCGNDYKKLALSNWPATWGISNGMRIDENTEILGNKAKGRISKWVFQENKARQIFRKRSISYPLIRTRMHQGGEVGVRNVWRTLFSWNTRFEIRPFALWLMKCE